MIAQYYYLKHLLNIRGNAEKLKHCIGTLATSLASKHFESGLATVLRQDETTIYIQKTDAEHGFPLLPLLRLTAAFSNTLDLEFGESSFTLVLPWVESINIQAK